MANQEGYVLSEQLLAQVKQTVKTVRDNPPKSPFGGAKSTKMRYLAQIGEKYDGVDFTDNPEDISYSAVQVYLSSTGQVEEASLDALRFGDDLDSSSLPPLVDMSSFNRGTRAEYKVRAGTMVEVFYFPDSDGEDRWFFFSNPQDIVQESGYPTDSWMYYDSAHLESAYATDSGWPTAQNGSGFVMTISTGVFYGADSSEDRTLYTYLRDMTYNAMGVLIHVSAERRQAVDVTDACN